jgi:hypothetical protein
MTHAAGWILVVFRLSETTFHSCKGGVRVIGEPA